MAAAGDGSSILTEGPKDTIKNVEQPYFLIGIKPGTASKREDRDKYARDIFGGAPGLKDVKITRAEPLRIGQSEAFEIMADGKDVGLRHGRHHRAVGALRRERASADARGRAQGQMGGGLSEAARDPRRYRSEMIED